MLDYIVMQMRKINREMGYSQPRLGTWKINGGRKFSEIKVQETRVLMFVVD